MSVPEQVRKQKEAIEQHYAAPAAASPEVVTEPIAPAPVEPNAPAPAPVPEVKIVDWEHKFKTVNGMLQAESKRNSDYVANLQGVIESMAAQIQDLQNATTQAQAAPATSSVTDKDREEWGDAIEMMRRVTRDEVGALMSRIAGLEEQLKKLSTLSPKVEKIEQSQSSASHASFLDQLTVHTPNWRETNADPEFRAWLLEADPLSGYIRDDLIKAAQASGDAARAAVFFKSWEALKAPATPAPNAPTPPAKSGELELQVAPSRASATAPAKVEDEQWDRDRITKFYNDVASGKYRDRPDEKKRLETSLFKATSPQARVA